MFEWHGWASIRATADSGDSRESFDRDEAAAVAVQEFVGRVPKDEHFETWAVRRPNGQTHVWLAGFRNHRQDRVLDVYRQIARLAPGSYGVLHLRNDELDGDAWNEWYRWVMARGSVTAELERSLTPHVGKVEDEEEYG